MRVVLRVRRTALLAGLLGMASAGAAPAPRVDTWSWDRGRLVAGSAGEGAPQAVGSLQKPFVAKAWAAAHPDARTPRWRCDGRRCWRRSGHGDLGLSHAVAVSCNEYFLRLAAETDPPLLRSTLASAGFLMDRDLTLEAVVGLGERVTIPPRRLLESYVELTRTPWASGERVRVEVLSGLRLAALEGTAQSLGRHGYWAKTGTAAAPGRGGPGTVGWALAVDDSGRAILARLVPGTGRDAARALGTALSRAVSEGLVAVPSSAGGAGRVRVRLFAATRPRTLRAVNRGSVPAAGTRGFVGPEGSVFLRPGDRLAESLWDLSIPDRGLLRRVKAALSCGADESGRLEVVAEMDVREYASGVIAAELGEGDAARRRALGAAVLRFVARGPRHPAADFCDTTHCAWFIGRGPRVRWPSPRRAVLEGGPSRPLEALEWAGVQAEARSPGPAFWTSHCGGRPLSAHALWGGGDREVIACPLHSASRSRPWSRDWPGEELTRAFGSPVTRVDVASSDGVYRLSVTTAAGTQRLLYDEAHERLAAVLGWGAMPSPPDRVVRSAAGFHAEGVGLGHRVGLCLGAP